MEPLAEKYDPGFTVSTTNNLEVNIHNLRVKIDIEAMTI